MSLLTPERVRGLVAQHHPLVVESEAGPERVCRSCQVYWPCRSGKAIGALLRLKIIETEWRWASS